MIGNKIFLLEDSITIFDVDADDLEIILMWANELGCKTHVLEDGMHFVVKVIGAEKNLYIFMQCALRCLNGIVR